MYLDITSENVDITLVMPSQLSSSRHWPRDEELEEPRRRRRIPNSRSLLIVFKVELAHEGSGEAIFFGGF